MALATVDAIRPSVVEPGDAISISGTGFVKGPVKVTFSGLFRPTGIVSEKKKSVTIDAMATSDQLIQIPVTDTLMDRLAKEPISFKGQVTVSFPSAMNFGSDSFEAQNDNLTIEFKPAGGAIVTIAERNRQAEKIGTQLGIEFADIQHKNKLLIAYTEPGGYAALNGVTPGDRLLAVDGIALETVADLSGVDLSQGHIFEFITLDGTIRSISVQLNVPKKLQLDEIIAIFFTAIALGLFFAFAAPKNKKPNPIFFRTTSETGSSSTFIFKVVGIALLSVPMLALPTITILNQSEIGVAIVVIVAFLTSTTGWVLYSKGAVIQRVFSGFTSVLPVLIIAGLAAKQGTTFGFFTSVLSQKSLFFGWHGFANPAMTLIVFLSMALIWKRKTNDNLVASVFALVSSTCSAMIIVVYLLGGWIVPFFDAISYAQSPALLLGAGAVFTLKTSLVLILSHHFSHFSMIDRRAKQWNTTKLFAKSVLLLTTGAVSFILTSIQVPGDLAIALRMLSAGVFTIVITSLLSRILRDQWPTTKQPNYTRRPALSK